MTAPARAAATTGAVGPARLAVLGDPVAHSLSPAMHNAAFAAVGVPAQYLAQRVAAGELGEALTKARAAGYLGLNLTVPHKEAALAHLDEVEPAARRLGAVNTVVFRDGRAFGTNTDGPGFLWSLTQQAGFDPHGCRAVVVGAGGAARSVAAALAEAGAARVDVVNRTRERAVALATSLGLSGDALDPDQAAAALGQADLVVNCTTQGMWPEVDGRPPADPRGMRPDALAMDIVYNPRPTRWLAMAAERGCRTLDGLGMLAGQAAAAWEVWFGFQGPAQVMMEAAVRALEGFPASVSNTDEHGPVGKGPFGRT